MNPSRSEPELVIERYARRDVGDLYSTLRPEVWMSFQERQRAMLRLLRRNAPKPLGDLRVLEIGCGSGSNLLELARLGFSSENLVGSELIPERAAQARRNLPAPAAVYEGDASCLPFEAETFDLVYSSLVFSSLLDADFQLRLAQRMWSWLKPKGAIMWYDLVYDNPWNRDVRGVPLKRIRTLFPDGTMTYTRVTLAPPIARRVVAVHPALYTLFNALPALRSHVFCWIRKP